jgi:PAS domain S-box-containing protein
LAKRRDAGTRFGLRAHLLALTLAILLPALAVGAAAAWQAVVSYRSAFEARLQDTAQALALALDARIGADLAVLGALAGAPALDTDADPAMREVLLVRAATSMGTDLALVDPVTLRYLVHTGLPPGAPMPVTAMTEAVVHVIETGQPIVADLSNSVVVGRLAIGPVVPVVRDGQMVAILAARLEPAALAALLQAQRLPDGGFAVLKDGGSRIVARTINHEAWLGQTVPPWFQEAMAGKARGLIKGRSMEETPTLGAFERLRVAPGWSVSLVVPRSAYTWIWVRPLGMLAVGAVPLLLLSAALALWLTRRLLRPVEALRRHARAVARGEDTAIAASADDTQTSGVAEFETLRADITAADAALRESEARLRLAAEAVGLGIWDVDLESETGIGTPRLFEIYGLPAPSGGRDRRAAFIDLIHPDDIAAVRAEHERAAREGDTFRLTHRIQRGSDKAERWVEVLGRHFWKAGRQHFLAVLTDVTERKAAEERQALLSREVDHRAKNALAVVQATLRLTPKEDAASYARAVEGRVGALARAQTLLAGDRWTGAHLRALVEGELAPFLGGQRAELDGPPVVLPAGAAQPIAMALHELATNAVKHGALSVPEGCVSVSWRVTAPVATLWLRWAETSGPVVVGPPRRRGFGMRVLEGTVRGQLGGTVSLTWEAAGLVCQMEVPLARGSDAAVVGKTVTTMRGLSGDVMPEVRIDAPSQGR